MARANERITRLRGFAWYAFQDQTVSTGIAGEHPFGVSTADEPLGEPVSESVSEPEPDEPMVQLPNGVEAAWVIAPDAEGLLNRAFGGAYLVLTTKDEKPELNTGWDIEPARLQEDFQMDQRGDRWVRLDRVIQTRDLNGRELQEVEMEVDRT